MASAGKAHALFMTALARITDLERAIQAVQQSGCNALDPRFAAVDAAIIAAVASITAIT